MLCYEALHDGGEWQRAAREATAEMASLELSLTEKQVECEALLCYAPDVA